MEKINFSFKYSDWLGQCGYKDIPFSVIDYFESNGDYVNIYVTSPKLKKRYTINKTLKSLVKILPIYFQRIHRGYLVNMYKIDNIGNKDLYVNDKIIPIGKTYKVNFKNKFKKMYVTI